MKGRFWTTIVYPESCKENWENYLEERGLVFAVSPLHDKDIDPTGEPKKPHWHLMLEWDGPTTFNNVKKICEEIGAVLPKKIESVRGMYRYLVHLDNPEKAQYKLEDIRHYNGFQIEISETEECMMLDKITDIIEGADIRNYHELINYFKSIGDVDLRNIALKKVYVIDRYISSRRNDLKEKLKMATINGTK